MGGRAAKDADDAVRFLVKRGVSASRLVDGFSEWAREDLPVQADRQAG